MPLVTERQLCDWRVVATSFFFVDADSGVARNFYFRGEQNSGSLGTDALGSKGEAPVGSGLGAMPPEADELTIKYVQLYSTY